MAEARIAIGSLIRLAQDGGWDAAPWILRGTQSALAAAPASAPINLAQFDIANIWNMIPHREWLLPPILITKHYSMLVATGASGKSAVAITLALALVTGRKDLLEMPVIRPCKVLLINGEDGQEELTRRIRATCQRFAIDPQHIAGRLHVFGARQIPGLTFNRLQPGGAVADEVGLNQLEALIRQTYADVVIIDPLGSFLPGGTNDGASASAVAGRLTEICVATNCAMLLVHHTSKAAQREGDNDPTAALGSAMWTNHARSVWNARRPTIAEAQAMGKPPSAIKDLLVLLHSKANLSRPEDAILIEMVSVELPNASPPHYPHGDKVGVATRLQPGAALSLFSPAILQAAIAQIAKGTASGRPYKASGRSGEQDYKPDIAAILAAHFQQDDQAAREKMAKSLIETLIKDGRLTIAHETLPRTGSGKGGGKRAPVLRVVPQPSTKPAGTGAPLGTVSVFETVSALLHGQSVPTPRGTDLPSGGVGEISAPETSHQRKDP